MILAILASHALQVIFLQMELALFALKVKVQRLALLHVLRLAMLDVQLAVFPQVVIKSVSLQVVRLASILTQPRRNVYNALEALVLKRKL